MASFDSNLVVFMAIMILTIHVHKVAADDHESATNNNDAFHLPATHRTRKLMGIFGEVVGHVKPVGDLGKQVGDHGKPVGDHGKPGEGNFVNKGREAPDKAADAAEKASDAVDAADAADKATDADTPPPPPPDSLFPPNSPNPDHWSYLTPTNSPNPDHRSYLTPTNSPNHSYLNPPSASPPYYPESDLSEPQTTSASLPYYPESADATYVRGATVVVPVVFTFWAIIGSSIISFL